MTAPLRRARFAVLFLALLLPGCAALKNLLSGAFEKPTLRFKSAKLRDASLSSLTVDLLYELDNPNSVGLSLAEVDYAFFVEGKQLTAGKPPNGLDLRARGKSELVFPAEVKFSDVAPVVQTFLKQDTAAYRAEGTLGVKTPLGIVRFPLEKEGRFEVPKVPEVKLGSPRIAELTLTGARLEVPLSLKNRSSFPLPIGGVTGQLSVGGSQVGMLSSGELGLLGAGETKTLALPVKVQFAQALGAANALRSGKGQVSLQGKITSGMGAGEFSVADLLTFSR